MNSLLIELEPNEKLYLELVDDLNIEKLISEIKIYIIGMHIYSNDNYFFINFSDQNNINHLLKETNLPKGTKIVLDNRNKKSKFIIHANVIVKNMDMFNDKKNDASSEIINWNSKEIKPISFQYDNQSVLVKNLVNLKMNNFSKTDDLLLKAIEECNSNSKQGYVSFRFLFMDGREFLKLFHYQMFIILKKYIEKLVIGHKNFKDNNYAIDVMVFVNDMDVKELGSAMIHKYVKNDENNLILPTNAIMRVNKRFLSKDKKDKINVKLIQTLFHELIHCLGFGYWELFRKNNDVLENPKVISIYQSIFNNNSELSEIPMTKDRAHYSSYNLPVIKNGKLWSILPALKYELLSDNDTDINVFTKLTAIILEIIGYKINYHLCDEYPLTPMAKELEIEYYEPTPNHFANGYEKYIMLLRYGNIKVSGIECFSMLENTRYIFHNRHNYKIYVVSKLDTDAKYLLGEEEGIEYYEDTIQITPNNLTPSLFFIVSSITFGGIPIIKIPMFNKIDYINCYNNKSLKRSIEEFIGNSQ